MNEKVTKEEIEKEEILHPHEAILNEYMDELSEVFSQIHISPEIEEKIKKEIKGKFKEEFLKKYDVEKELQKLMEIWKSIYYDQCNIIRAEFEIEKLKNQINDSVNDIETSMMSFNFNINLLSAFLKDDPEKIKEQIKEGTKKILIIEKIQWAKRNLPIYNAHFPPDFNLDFKKHEKEIMEKIFGSKKENP